MKSYFVFDVESMGLHGEGFAVAGGVYLENGAVQWEFAFACDPDEAQPAWRDNRITTKCDRKWVSENVPVLEITHRSTRTMRKAFWAEWLKAKNYGAVMAADCAWPVEARFILKCLEDEPRREGECPYPFHEIASFMQAAGMDPMKTYDREPSELPRHNPLCDARQSARLLALAISKLSK